MLKPILLTTPMVQATLEDRKYMTRRLNGLREINGNPNKWGFREISYDSEKHCTKAVFVDNQQNLKFIKLPWEHQDILWVRETWADLRGMGFYNDHQTKKPWNFAYKANIKSGSDSDRARIDYGVKWKPSIYMPKEAARLFLKVIDINLERLQNITEKQAKKEGINCFSKDHIIFKYAVNYDWWIDYHHKNKKLFRGTGWQDMPRTAIKAFEYLWDSTINKAELDCFGWNANPWVWVITFERLRGAYLHCQLPIIQRAIGGC